MTAKLKLINNRMRKISSKFYNINRGGCGHFAKILYYKLRFKGYNPKIVVCCDEGRNSIGIIKQMDACCHVLIEIRHRGKDWLIDSDGVWEKATYYTFRIAGYLSIQSLEKLLKADGWNSCFSTSQLPAIKKEINRQFTDF